MGLFSGIKKARAENYKYNERELYVALLDLQALVTSNKKEGKYYLLDSTDRTYKRAFQYSYTLVEYYTKHLNDDKQFEIKRNFLLSKTRGLFSDHKKKKIGFYDMYYIRADQIETFPEEYLKFFKLEEFFTKNE